jgi:hypothetical protein
MIRIVATLCHLVTIDPASHPLTVCHRETIAWLDMNINQCGLLLPGVVDWKGKSAKYAGDDWIIAGVQCTENLVDDPS